MFRLRLCGLLLICGLIGANVNQPLNAETLRVPGDHATIQGAIDAAKPNDVVLVEPGVYRERLRLSPQVTVRSAGDDTRGERGLLRAEATIIDGDFDTAQGAGVEMAEGATLDGFTVTGVGVYDDDSWNKHHATQGEEQAHEPIGEPGVAGVSAIGVTCLITNNIVHHIGYTGIAIQGVEGKRTSPHVLRNVCYRNMGGGIGSMKKSTATIEENVCFENFYAGIGHADASPTVINNTCYGNVRAGIGISEGACPIVRGNQCFKNRRAGIGIRTGSSTQPIVSDNDCYENDMAGIGTREEASPVIRNNRCYKNKLAGIGSRTGATPKIIGNECYENGASGIGQQTGAETVLIGNYLHHNASSGIGFAACESGKATVVDNRIIDNEKVAVGINPGWTVLLSGNQLSRQGGLPPIVMVFEGSQATLTDNVIEGGGVAGVRVAGKVLVEGNEFIGTSLRRVGPPNFAVWALAGSEVSMTGNDVHGWRHALHATESTVSASENRVRDFGNAAFVVQQPVSPADVFGNTAVSKDPKAQVLVLDGESGVVEANVLKSAESGEE